MGDAGQQSRCSDSKEHHGSLGGMNVLWKKKDCRGLRVISVEHLKDVGNIYLVLQGYMIRDGLTLLWVWVWVGRMYPFRSGLAQKMYTFSL